MNKFIWNPEKNKQLAEERGVSFERIVFAIQRGDLIDVFDHPNQDRYPGQRVYAVSINNYVYLVPFVKEDESTHFLKTIIPS